MDSTLPAAVLTADEPSGADLPCDAAQQQQKQKQSLALVTAKNFVSGTVAGGCEAVVGYPLETVKARMQTDKTHSFSGPLDCLQKSVREGGVTSLYRGATPQIFRSAIR